MKLLVGACGSSHVGLLPVYLQLVRRQLDASIRVIMTESAQYFMPASTLTTFSGSPVYTHEDRVQEDGSALHIALAAWADHVLVLPATASLMFKVSHGASDDLLTTTLLASARPATIAPAMNLSMWRSGPVKRNLETLEQDGHRILVGPSCPATHESDPHAQGGISPTPRLVVSHLAEVQRLLNLEAPNDLPERLGASNA